MLNGIINGKDLQGENNTRTKLHNAATEFTVDTRKSAKDFEYEHHHVADLHGDRYCVCVRSGKEVLLLESDGKAENVVIITSVDSKIYDSVREEAHRQLGMHLAQKRAATARRKASRAKKATQ